MDKKIAVLFFSAALLCGCSDKTTWENAENSPYTDVAAVGMQSEENTTELFGEYSFGFKGTKENYLIAVRRGKNENELSVMVENNRYVGTEYVITAPDGYVPSLPYEQKNASSAVNVITNDIDDTYIPDILQLYFDLRAEDNGDASGKQVQRISRLYTVNDKGELREIQLCRYSDTDGDGEAEEQVMDYLDRTGLYHSEPDKFIYEITVDENNIRDKYGEVLPIESRVKIQTFTFEPQKLRMTLGYEEIREDNPLYFGYAYWSAANLMAQYFVMKSFNISDWDNYIERPDENDSSYTDYYFRIDDSRFSNVDELQEFVESVFTESFAKQLLENSPQNYCDINGELYGMVGDAEVDSTLGMLTFSGMEITEDRMTFRSRQEKYDESGNYSGYTDGGVFVMIRDAEKGWRVSTYRFPYSY